MLKKIKGVFVSAYVPAFVGLTTASVMASNAYAGILVDSAGKNAVDGAQSDIEEIGGATILVACVIWSIKATRRIAG